MGDGEKGMKRMVKEERMEDENGRG